MASYRQQRVIYASAEVLMLLRWAISASQIGTATVGQQIVLVNNNRNSNAPWFLTLCGRNPLEDWPHKGPVMRQAFPCPGVIIVIILVLHRDDEAMGMTLLCDWCWLRSCLDSKVRVTNMGPTWVLWTPGGPHVGPMNFAIRVYVSVYWTIKSTTYMWLCCR